MTTTENQDRPVKIEYKRWRHKTRAYTVEVFQVENFRGKHGWFTMVSVIRKGESKMTSWPSGSFLKEFEPYGRRLKRKTRYARLMEG